MTVGMCLSWWLAYLVLAHVVHQSVTMAATTDEIPTADDLKVTKLQDIEPEYTKFAGDMYAGRLPFQQGDRSGKMMFWMFQAHEPVVEDTIVIWLNGGPGCTSFNGGVFFETAPVMVEPQAAGSCCATDHEPLKYNKYTWANAVTMLYPEQPVGVGFSSGSAQPQNETDLSNDFYAWLQVFVKVFPKYVDYKWYVVGESYAGMYAPSIGRKIMLEALAAKEAGDEADSDHKPLHLAGVGLGNSWVNARIQGPAVIDYAFWHGLIDLQTRKGLHRKWESCISDYENGIEEEEDPPFHPFNVPDDCAMEAGALLAAGKNVDRPGKDRTLTSGPNEYDVTTWDWYPQLNSLNSTARRFLNNPAVKDALHAPQEIEWFGCIPGAGRRRHRRRKLTEEREVGISDASATYHRLLDPFYEDRSGHQEHRRLDTTTNPVTDLLEEDQPQSTLPYIAELLENNVRVMVYSGDRDLSTNIGGSSLLLSTMKWSKADQWPDAPRGLWTYGKETAGYEKRLDGLSLVTVYNSGHLVPFNQPEHALDLITRFTQNRSFSDYPLDSLHELAKIDTKKEKESTEGSSKRKSGGIVVNVVLSILALFVAFGAGYYVSFLLDAKGLRGVNGINRKDYDPIT